MCDVYTSSLTVGWRAMVGGRVISNVTVWIVYPCGRSVEGTCAFPYPRNRGPPPGIHTLSSRARAFDRVKAAEVTVYIVFRGGWSLLRVRAPFSALRNRGRHAPGALGTRGFLGFVNGAESVHVSDGCERYGMCVLRQSVCVLSVCVLCVCLVCA